MLVIFCIAYLAGLVHLVYVAYSSRWHTRYVVAKTALSAGFIAVACAAAFVHGQWAQPFFWGMLLCMLLCLVGDWALGVANTRRQFFSRWFKRGAAAFTLAHGGFCLLFSLTPPQTPWHWWDIALPCALLAITAACVYHPQFKLRRMHLQVPALVYSVCVGLMCARSISFALARGFHTQGALVALGGVLFLLSDTVLLFLYFYVRPRKTAHAVNLITYYLAMLCLALAV